MGLRIGQDLCVGRSHLCCIAEVQPNDPGPRARRHHLTLRAGVLAPGVSAEKRKAPEVRFAPPRLYLDHGTQGTRRKGVARSVIGNRHSATVCVAVTLVRSGWLWSGKPSRMNALMTLRAVRERSDPHEISVTP